MRQETFRTFSRSTGRSSCWDSCTCIRGRSLTSCCMLIGARRGSAHRRRCSCCHSNLFKNNNKIYVYIYDIFSESEKYANENMTDRCGSGTSACPSRRCSRCARDTGSIRRGSADCSPTQRSRHAPEACWETQQRRWIRPDASPAEDLTVSVCGM